MTLLERKVDAIAQVVLATSDDEKKAALIDLCALMQQKQEYTRDVRNVTADILLEMGVPDKLAGHALLIEAVDLITENEMLQYSITNGLYPEIAERFNSSVGRVERCIRHAIEVAWTRIGLDIMTKYFGNTVDPMRGKPTNSEFIARLMNVVRKRMAGGT